MYKIGIVGLALLGAIGILYWHGASIRISFIGAGENAALHEASTDNHNDNTPINNLNNNDDSTANPTPSENTSDSPNAFLSNPHRGWYQINQYYLSDTDFPDDTAIAESLDLNGGMRLSLAEYNLAEYADSALSERAIAEIRTTFSIAKEQGVGLIVRFLYD